jgi:hypothetical protein
MALGHDLIVRLAFKHPADDPAQSLRLLASPQQEPSYSGDYKASCANQHDHADQIIHRNEDRQVLE